MRKGVEKERKIIEEKHFKITIIEGGGSSITLK